MPREIKFRAWIAGRQEMSKPFGLLDIDGGFAAPGGEWAESFDLEEAPPIMQYTGLKDMNGREIYEGDLVAATGLRGQLEVVWHEAGVFLKWEVTTVFGTDSGYTPLSLADITKNGLTVVGNIYENGELLQAVPIADA